ncbi:MAG TPA: hypothetical protein VGO26_07235 [Amnibacterium sp.]|jgi:hypothetical protein|nr:hypothetical protein [Amnibacterium sp.]
MSPELAAAGRRRAVRLTTVRRSAVAVATPVRTVPAGTIDAAGRRGRRVGRSTPPSTVVLCSTDPGRLRGS